MMTTTYRRIALLTGASVAALAATPALAQTAPHTGLPDGTYAGVDTTDDTVVICDLAAADPNCFFGVIDTTNPALAVVNTTGTGRIYQHDAGGLVELDMLNAAGDTAEVGAIAMGGTDAQANVSYAIYQTGTGTDVTLNFQNDGYLLIDALAYAEGGAALAADADAYLYAGIGQSATGTTVDINHVNNGTISAIASAVATAVDFADARADNSYAIWQFAAASTATLDVDNNGLINVEANAFASADNADATAIAHHGIWQSASVASAAALNIVNDGTFSMAANATALGSTFASAVASANDGLEQNITSGGTGIAAVSNNGIVNVSANANASATGVGGAAYAYAYGYDAVYQSVAAASTGTALVVNGVVDGTATDTGIIALHASANAVGVTYASASASVAEGIQQEVTVGIAGLAQVTNNGTIALAANASASATSGIASANAYAYNGILQSVTAGDTGVAMVMNDGTISLTASAAAAGTSGGYASASASGGIAQSVVAGTAGLALVTNLGVVSVSANAAASGSDAHADAYAYNGISQAVSAGSTGSAIALNSGTVALHASALALGTGHASASASASGGIVQDVNSGSAGFAQVTNVGLIAISAHASASATSAASAYAYAYDGISQEVDAVTVGSAIAVNSGTIALTATALATATVYASASAEAGGGIRQDVDAATVLEQATNVGLISLNAYASANASDATASANAYSAITQDFAGGALIATQSAVNSGTITLAATAVANGFETPVGGTAAAYATAYGGMVQYGTIAAAGELNALLVNNGAIALSANATASAGADAIAYAFAGSALGQFQSAGAGALVNATITNGGTITVTANAVAVAGDASLVDNADASAVAYGIGQHIDGGTVNFVINNSGELNVGAHATASAQEEADANAYVSAVYQVLHGDTNTALFTNSGVINANASAVANATDPDPGLFSTATATAIGYWAGGGTGTLTAVNSGTMAVSATAIAAHYASANAVGMVATGVFGSVSLSNAGTLSVVASASGGTSSAASAVGMAIVNSAGVLTVSNSGTLAVDAITAGNGPAEATGILVTTAGVPVAGDITTVNNSGDIIVRESEDGGATWQRGMAIDLNGSLNPNVVNLLGGNIYGNIGINEGDDIFVEVGDTYFDGIVNPECHVNEGGLGPAIDNPLVNACGVGTLTIQNGGNLILAGPNSDVFDGEGPAYVFVDTFTVMPDGTITYILEPVAGGDQPLGSYPQVFADTANLDGTLVADVRPLGGLFADNYFWNNVIDAVVRNGQFDECVLAGAYADSPLLTGSFAGGEICSYDAAGNVDLGIQRVAFDAVPGLTLNQGSVASGLECLYEDAVLADLAGTGLGEAIAELFLFDGAGYPMALEQLTGAGYAGYLQSFNSLGYHYNQILARATDCEVPALAGSALACRVAPMHLWGQVDYDTLDKDGDVEAGDYDADRWSFLIGGDISVTPAAVVGVSVGKVTNKVKYDDIDSRVKGDGWQFGAYGTYDPGQFYVKALGTYTKMDGDARRGIDWTPFGGTLAGEMEGDPDVKMWTFGLHGGFRIPMGPTSVVTPFLNYDYTNAKLKGFTETGDTGVELTVNGGREKHSWLTGGVKWAGQMGGLVPEASIGYRHMFGDRRASFNANFAGFEENCDFDIVSMTEKRGAILAGLSVGGLLGMVDVRVGYNGAFNSDMKEHSGFLKLVVPLGAVAAPPPPPVVIAPPPPPAPATQTCPDGSVILATDICPAPPPPPPPPAPAPERG